MDTTDCIYCIRRKRCPDHGRDDANCLYDEEQRAILLAKAVLGLLAVLAFFFLGIPLIIVALSPR